MSDRKHVLKVVVTDLETGETEEALVPAGEYMLLVTAPAYLAHAQMHKGGETAQLTIKDRILR